MNDRLLFVCFHCGRPLPEQRLYSYTYAGVLAGVWVCSLFCKAAQDAQWRIDQQAWRDRVLASGGEIL